jgi:hypothetical protein
LRKEKKRREEKISLTKSVLLACGRGRMESAFLYNVPPSYLDGNGEWEMEMEMERGGLYG